MYNKNITTLYVIVSLQAYRQKFSLSTPLRGFVKDIPIDFGDLIR